VKISSCIKKKTDQKINDIFSSEERCHCRWWVRLPSQSGTQRVSLAGTRRAPWPGRGEHPPRPHAWQRLAGGWRNRRRKIGGQREPGPSLPGSKPPGLHVHRPWLLLAPVSSAPGLPGG